MVFGACFNDIAHKNATISLEHAAALATLRVGRFNQKQGEKRQGPELGYPSLGTANVALHRCAVRRALELGINVRPDLFSSCASRRPWTTQGSAHAGLGARPAWQP